jgi:cytochrome c oxidase cbb3-type subunit 3
MKNIMADLPSSFWGGWIAVLTIVSLLGLAWLLFGVYFSKQDSEEHGKIIWDQTLNEGEHPAPIWWFWMILSLMIISVVYLLFYPGLGTFSGVLKWSQNGRIEESYVEYRAEFDAIRNAILSMSMEELQEDGASMNSAERIFDRNCAMCHGREALGIPGSFPNLRDDEWHWGGSPERIEQSIRNGRQASMPAWGARLNDEEINQVVRFIQNMGSGNTIPGDDPGKVIYGQLCFSCHGTDGTGNINLGVPSLANEAWLYGDSDAILTETITHGRSGTMPAFQNRLNDVQIRLLVAWLTR